MHEISLEYDTEYVEKLIRATDYNKYLKTDFDEQLMKDLDECLIEYNKVLSEEN